MIDRVRILIQAGNGGNGCESYLRRNDRKAAPFGGYGGNGGSVIFRADPKAPSIAQFLQKRHLIAESGAHGGSNRKRGKNGVDLVFLVPQATRLYDRTHNLLIRDFMKDQEEVVIVAGGCGGVGNQGGKKATLGAKGEMMDLEITVCLTADVCFVGLPNSGKSSLLNQLTHAHLKTDAYPFTTRVPELGVCHFSDFESIKLCELPSLYQRSHDGRGLGNGFLKHLELVKGVLYVVDPVSQFANSLEEGYAILKDEIGKFDPRFLNIRSAIVVNKMDIPEARVKSKQEAWQPGIRVFQVSAVTGEGFEALKDFLKSFMDSNNA